MRGEFSQGAVSAITLSTEESVLLTKQWDDVLRKVHDQIGETSFRRWFGQASLGVVTEHEVEIRVPTKFMRDWVETHYADRVRDLWRAVRPRILRVHVVVGAESTKPGAAPPSAVQAAPLDMGSARVLPFTQQARDSAREAQPMEAPKTSTSDNVINLNPLDRIDTLSSLDPRFTFENFVVGKSNEFAYAAAQRVAENPTATINPLFLYGGVGLGKTHLMHAIAWQISKQSPGRSVLYMSAEKFMFQFIRALRHKDTMSFKEQFRSVDVLMIDDVQFISGKDSTQEEFFHTFNALVDQSKQVVISADKSPSDLEGLQERLRSRLGWGLCADIHPTTYELRLGILHAKCEQMQRPVPEKVLQFLAHKITSNVRELEGALNRVLAHADLVGRDITLETVHEHLADLLRAYDKRITIEDIQKRVAEHYTVKLADMVSNRRARTVARPRQVAMYLAKNLTSRSLPEIGRKFGGRDHTTVIHAVRKIEELRLEDPSLVEDIELLRRLLQGN